MIRALHAEWGKTWSLRAAWLAVPGALLLTVGVAVTLVNDFLYDIAQHHRPRTDTMAVLGPLGAAAQLGQLALVALAVLVVSSEYGTGVIRATFLARPRRGDVLIAKTVVAASVGFAGALVSSACGWWASSALLGSHAAHGSPVSGCLRLALVSLFACAFTTAVAFLLRNAAGALTTVFVLLVGTQVLPPRIASGTPAGAAVDFVSGKAGGLLVLAGWTVAALALAGVLLSRRDA